MVLTINIHYHDFYFSFIQSNVSQTSGKYTMPSRELKMKMEDKSVCVDWSM